MKKYEEYNIRKEDISEFKGLGKETFFSPRYSYDMLPLDISVLGITNPDPDYYIKRDQSRCFILEYIASGRGYLTVNGESYALKEIAEYLCFSSEYHFSNFFKSKTGSSPREYKKKSLKHEG